MNLCFARVWGLISITISELFISDDSIFFLRFFFLFSNDNSFFTTTLFLQQFFFFQCHYSPFDLAHTQTWINYFRFELSSYIANCDWIMHWNFDWIKNPKLSIVIKTCHLIESTKSFFIFHHTCDAWLMITYTYFFLLFSFQKGKTI